jgi:hypothetical protein
MKMCEIYDQILNKGIQQEKANTEKERRRAEAAQKRAETAEKENERLRKILLEHNVSF